MFIHTFQDIRSCNVGETVQVKLPGKNMILDPRPSYPDCIRFDCNYHDDGITVMLTRIDSDSGSFSRIGMRVYNPAIEVVPTFDSTTTYTYFGNDGEYAPRDATVIIIHPSVTIIKDSAFNFCTRLRRCIMHDRVKRISRRAFYACHYLDALFLPSSLVEIGAYAFQNCENMKILSLLPDDLDHVKMGYEFLLGCDTFEEIMTQMTGSPYRNQMQETLPDLYRNLPPLHKACLDINVSAQVIEDTLHTHGVAEAYNTAHGGMTPLHILSLNPHATAECILTCFEVNMNAVFVKDVTGETPLDHLREYDIDSHIVVIASICIHRDNMRNAYEYKDRGSLKRPRPD